MPAEFDDLTRAVEEVQRAYSRHLESRARVARLTTESNRQIPLDNGAATAASRANRDAAYQELRHTVEILWTITLADGCE